MSYNWKLVNVNDPTAQEIHLQEFIKDKPLLIAIYTYVVIANVIDETDTVMGMTANQLWFEYDLPPYTLPYNKEFAINRENKKEQAKRFIDGEKLNIDNVVDTNTDNVMNRYFLPY